MNRYPEAATKEPGASALGTSCFLSFRGGRPHRRLLLSGLGLLKNVDGEKPCLRAEEIPCLETIEDALFACAIASVEWRSPVAG